MSNDNKPEQVESEPYDVYFGNGPDQRTGYYYANIHKRHGAFEFAIYAATENKLKESINELQSVRQKLAEATKASGFLEKHWPLLSLLLEEEHPEVQAELKSLSLVQKVFSELRALVPSEEKK